MLPQRKIQNTEMLPLRKFQNAKMLPQRKFQHKQQQVNLSISDGRFLHFVGLP